LKTGVSEFELNEWISLVRNGCFTPDDGVGYYVVNGKETEVCVFFNPPGDIYRDHIQINWYNK